MQYIGYHTSRERQGPRAWVLRTVPAPFIRAFELLARLRAAPAFHPDGVLYEGEATVRGPGPLPPGQVDCLVRLSKGIGTPRGVPDLLGVAVRLLHDPPVDVLCSSAPGRRRVAALRAAAGAPLGRHHGHLADAVGAGGEASASPSSRCRPGWTLPSRTSCSTTCR